MLHLDNEFLRQLFITQVYTSSDESIRVFDDGKECNYLAISQPRVEAKQDGIHILSIGQAKAGTPILSKCVAVLNWDGFVEVIQQPELLDSHIIRLQTSDSHIYGTDMEKHLGTGKVWDWIKGYVHPHLDAVAVDLNPALDDLRFLFPLVVPSDDSERVQRLLDSLTLSDVRLQDDGLAATLSFELEETIAAAESVAESALSPEELAQWEMVWRGWDSFLTFIVKNAAASTGQHQLRAELFDVLLKARHDLIEVLSVPRRPGPDPVRKLFVDTWKRLAPVLRHLSGDLPGESAMRYLSLITAAEALRAIDELGPDTGLEISLDGLRRMARILAPDSTEDPLIYDLEVDPELRELFDFGPPLSPPRPNPDVDTSGSWIPKIWAAEAPDSALVHRLNTWVPERDEIAAYLPLVAELLNHVVDVTLEGPRLEQQYHPLYRPLVLATAWQETCWRQFVKRNEKIVPLRSSAGAVGIMQVVPQVWRGFYDSTGLHKDIAYNASAGSEILIHYLVDYSLAKGEHQRTGGEDNLVHATYAAYNGGPSHLTRYRKEDTSERLREIDRSFWEKYTEVRDGQELAVARCYEDPAT
ncbi:MAG: lytic transglycosylase domain-containing protein [Gammaproteobacteria bacterium]|nr:lytic transglycosylase domain-containing protein [Gammaproteobacteria bacterium]